MPSMEKEVKWEADSRSAFRRFVHALKQTSGPLSPALHLSITDRYLEDPTGSLAAQKTALRIRRTGRHFEATLKTRTRLVNGVAAREEYTLPLPGARSAVQALRALAEHGPWHGWKMNQLAVRFILRNYRTVYTVCFRSCVCEAALDRYVISAAGKIVKKREIELELKKGPEADFLAFATALSQLTGLPRAQISKVASAEKMLQSKN